MNNPPFATERTDAVAAPKRYLPSTVKFSPPFLSTASVLSLETIGKNPVLLLHGNAAEVTVVTHRMYNRHTAVRREFTQDKTFRGIHLILSKDRENLLSCYSIVADSQGINVPGVNVDAYADYVLMQKGIGAESGLGQLTLIDINERARRWAYDLGSPRTLGLYVTRSALIRELQQNRTFGFTLSAESVNTPDYGPAALLTKVFDPDQE